MLRKIMNISCFMLELFKLVKKKNYPNVLYYRNLTST